jgi:hypothetical protein
MTERDKQVNKLAASSAEADDIADFYFASVQETQYQKGYAEGMKWMVVYILDKILQ